MRKGLMVLDNSVSEMTAFLTINDDRPDGFTIISAAVPNIEYNVFSKEAMEAAGFAIEKGKVPDGFFLLSEEYTQYLAALKTAQQDHPGNVNGLPWNGESGHVMCMPSQEDAIAAQGAKR